MIRLLWVSNEATEGSVAKDDVHSLSFLLVCDLRDQMGHFVVSVRPKLKVSVGLINYRMPALPLCL